MNHPAAMLLPILMLSDYWLTVAGARLHDTGYAAHFKQEHYELNPIWQATIARRRWLNPRHLALTALLSGAFIALLEFFPARNPLAALFLGAMVGLFGMINGRHAANLALFAYVRRHPGMISGVVTLQHEVTLWMSLCQLLPVTMTLAAILIVAPNPAAIGAFVGLGAFAILHVIWLSRQRRAGVST